MASQATRCYQILPLLWLRATSIKPPHNSCKQQAIQRLKRSREVKIRTFKMINQLVIAISFTAILEMVTARPVFNKRDVTATTKQDSSPHCSLPVTTEEYPTFLFRYNVEDAIELNEIKKAVEGYSDNFTVVQSANVVESTKIITFTMNRAAYLKVYKNNVLLCINCLSIVTYNLITHGICLSGIINYVLVFYMYRPAIIQQ